MSPLLIVQCRYNSSRLPGKALYPLPNQPMLVFLLRRLKKARLEGRIILATTEQPEDDVVTAWGRVEGVEVVRGEADDVLARYLRCLKLYPSPYLVRITADNPLTDPGLVAKVYREMERGSWDYVSALEGFPVGVGVDAFSTPLLETVAKKARDRIDREHINAYVLDNEKNFRCFRLTAPVKISKT